MKRGCCQSQNYKIWKQFTTYTSGGHLYNELLSITKLQNLKAIHNIAQHIGNEGRVVVNHKTTKFESNSQHNGIKVYTPLSCCQSQNYKIWKQFTTLSRCKSLWRWLLSITKLQNLKAIHNGLLAWFFRCYVVVNHKTTKFESNSQQ